MNGRLAMTLSVAALSLAAQLAALDLVASVLVAGPFGLR